MARFTMSSKRAYNWYISLVAASCMVLYGYDASVFNALQGSDNWVAYFNDPDDYLIGTINTAYVVGAIVAGFVGTFFLFRDLGMDLEVAVYSGGNPVLSANSMRLGVLVLRRTSGGPMWPADRNGSRRWICDRGDVYAMFCSSR